jgi:hypothetical protein
LNCIGWKLLDPVSNLEIGNLCAGTNSLQTSIVGQNQMWLWLPAWKGQASKFSLNTGTEVWLLEANPSVASAAANVLSLAGSTLTVGSLQGLDTSYLSSLFAAPAANKICTGQTVMGVAGTAICTPPPNCASDGEVGCVADAAFPAAKMSNFDTWSIVAGKTIAGVSGSAHVGSLLGSGAHRDQVAPAMTYAQELALGASVVWRDNRTGMLWSDKLADTLGGGTTYNWCLASGNTETDAECGTADRVAPSLLVKWRLPTKYDFEVAEHNGIWHVLPNMVSFFWSASVYTENRTNAWRFYGSNGLVNQQLRLNSYSVRCVGVR